MKIQLKINTTKDTVKIFDVALNSQSPLVITKPENVANYELFDVELGRAPEKIFVLRKDNDLYIAFSQKEEADIIIKDYYDDHCLVPIVGLNELGGYQAFIPPSNAQEEFIVNLSENILAEQVLGGDIHYCAAPILFTWTPFLTTLVGLVGFGAIAEILRQQQGGTTDTVIPTPPTTETPEQPTPSPLPNNPNINSPNPNNPDLPRPVLETPPSGALIINKVPSATVYEITHLKEGDKRQTTTIVELDSEGNIAKITQIAPNGELVNNPTVDVKIVDGKIVLGSDEIEDGSQVSVVAKDNNGRTSPPTTATVGYDETVEDFIVTDTGLLDRNNDGIPDAARPKLKTGAGKKKIEVLVDNELIALGESDPQGNGELPINLLDGNGNPIDPSRVEIRVSEPGKNPKSVKLSDVIDSQIPPKTPNDTFIKAPELKATQSGQGEDKQVQIEAKVDPNTSELDIRVDSTPDNRSDTPEKTLKLKKDSEGNWTIGNPQDFPGAEIDPSSSTDSPKVNIPNKDNFTDGNLIDAVARNPRGNESEPSNAVKITDNGIEEAPALTEQSATPTITTNSLKAFDESTPADQDPETVEFSGKGPANSLITVYKKEADGTLTPVATTRTDGNGNYSVSVSDVGKNQLNTGDKLVVKATEAGKLPSDESNEGEVPAVPAGAEGHTYDTIPPLAPTVLTKPNTDDGSAQITPNNPKAGDEMTVGFKPQKANETDPDTLKTNVPYTFDGEKWTTTVPEADRKGLPESFTGTLNIPEELIEDGSEVSALVTDLAGNNSPQNSGEVGYDSRDNITQPPVVRNLESIDNEPEANRTIEKVRSEIDSESVSIGDELILRNAQGEKLDSVKITNTTPTKEIDGKTYYLVDFTPPSNNPVVANDPVNISAKSPNKGESSAVPKTVPAVLDGNLDDEDKQGAVDENGKALADEDTYGGHTEKNPPNAPAILVGGDANSGEPGNNYATVTIPPYSDILELMLTPKGGAETSVRLVEQADGSWKSSHPNIIPNQPAGTTRFTIPAGTLEDNSEITAQAKDIAGNASAKTGNQITAYGASATPTIDSVKPLDPTGDGRPDQLEVTGTVKNPDGTPVAEGTPVVLKDQNGTPIGTGVTDQDGNYKIITPLIDGGVVDVNKVSVEATEKGKAPSKSEEQPVPALTQDDSTPPNAPVHEKTDNPGEVKFSVDPNAKTTTASFKDEMGVSHEIEVNHQTGEVKKKDGSPLPENINVTVDKEGNSFTIDANSIMDNSQVEATSENEGGKSPTTPAFAGKDKGEQTNGEDNLPVGEPLTPPTPAKLKTPIPSISSITATDSDGEADGKINSVTVKGKTEPYALVTIEDDKGNRTSVVADGEGNYTGTIVAPKGGSINPNAPLTVRATAPNKTISDPNTDSNVPAAPTDFADNTPPVISGTLNDKRDVVFELPSNAKEGETVLVRIPSADKNTPPTEVLLTKQGGKWNVPAGKEDLVQVDGNTATVPDAVTGPDVLVTATATDLAGNSATAEVSAGREQTPMPIIDSISPLDTSPVADNDPEQFVVKGRLPKNKDGSNVPDGTKVTITDDKGNVIGTGTTKDGEYTITAIEHPDNPLNPSETPAKIKVIAEEPNKLPSEPAQADIPTTVTHIGDHTSPAPGDAEIDYSSGEPVGKVTLPSNGEGKTPVNEGDKGTISVTDQNGNTTFVVGVTYTGGKWVRDPAPNHTEGNLDDNGVFTIPSNKLDEGSIVSVVTHDKVGNRSEPDSATVIGQTPPVTELTVTPYDGDTKADRDPDLFDISGKTTAPVGSQVNITANGKVVATAIVEAGTNGENTFSVKLKESADNNIQVGDTFTATVEQDGKRPSKPFDSQPVAALEDFNPADHIGDREKPAAPVKVEPTEESGDEQYTVGDDVYRLIVNIVPTGKDDDNDVNVAVVTITRGADGKWKSNRPDLVDNGDVVTADQNNGSTLTIKAGKGTVKKVTAVDLAGNSSDAADTTTPTPVPSVDDFTQDRTAPSPTPITVDDDGSLRFDLPEDAKEGDHVALTFGKKDPNGGDPTDEVPIVLKKQGDTWVVVEAKDSDAKNKTGKVTNSDLKTLLGLGEPITGNTLSIPRDKVIAMGDDRLADDISVSTIGVDEHGNQSLQKKAVVEFTATPTNIQITSIDDSFVGDKNPERFRITADSSEPDGTVVTAKDKNGNVIGHGVVQGGKVTINATELNDKDGDIKIGDNITLEAKAPNKAYSQPSEGTPVPEATEHTETIPPADPVLTVKPNGDIGGTFPEDADEVELKVGDNTVKVVKKPTPTEDNPSAVTYELDPNTPNLTGVTVDPNTGEFTIPAVNVPKKDGTNEIDPDKITAQSGDLAGNKGNEVHPTPPAVAMEKTKTPEITEIIPVSLDNPSDNNPEQLIVRGTLDEPDGTEVFVYDHNNNPIGRGVVQGGKFEVIATEKDSNDNDIRLGKGQQISANAKAPNKTLSEKTTENLDDNSKVGEMQHPNDGYAEPPVITPDGKVIFPKDTKEGDIAIEREGQDPINIKVTVDDEGNVTTDNDQIPAGNITRDPQTGEIVVKIPKEVIIPEGSTPSEKPPVIKATDKDIAGNPSEEAEREFGAAPHVPDVVANNDGSVDIFFPPHAVVGDRLVVNYDPQDETKGNFTEVVYEKQPNGSWTKVSGDPDNHLQIGDDKITIPEDKVTDNTVVSSYAHNSVARSQWDEDTARPAAGDGTEQDATPLSEVTSQFVDKDNPANGIAEEVVVTGKTDPFATVRVNRGDKEVVGKADKDGNFTIFVPVEPNASGENDSTPFSVTAVNEVEGKTPTTQDTTPDGMIFKDKTAPHIDVDPTPHGAEVLFPENPVKGDKVEVFKTPKGGETPEQPSYEYTFDGENWTVTGGTEQDSAPQPVDNRIDVPAEAGSKVKGKITDLAGNSNEEEVPVGEQVEPLPPVQPQPQPEAPQDTKAPSPAPVKASPVNGSVTVEMPDDAEVGDFVNVKLTPTDPSILPETLPEGVTQNDDGSITLKLTKQPDGGWSSPLPNIVPPVPSGSNSNSTTIPEEAVKDGTQVETQAEDPAGNKSPTREGIAGKDAKTPAPVQIRTESIDLSDKADENAEKAVIKGKVPNVPKGTKVFLEDENGKPIAETETTTDEGDFTFILVENGFEGKLTDGSPAAKVPSVDVGDNFLIYAKEPNKKASEKVPAQLPAIEPATGDADGQHGGHQGDTTTPEAPKLKAQEGKGNGGVNFGTPEGTIPGDKVRLELTDENDQPHTVELTHQPDGSWKVTKVDNNEEPTPEQAENVIGFSEIPAGQTSTLIPEDKLSDGSTVTGRTFDQSGKKSGEASAKAGNDEVTRTPEITGITAKDNDADNVADFDPDEVTVTVQVPGAGAGVPVQLIDPETGEKLGDPVETNDQGIAVITLTDTPANKYKEGTPIQAVATENGKEPSEPSNIAKVPEFTRITDPTDNDQFTKAQEEHSDRNTPAAPQLSDDVEGDADGSLTLTLPDPANPDNNLQVGDKVAVKLTPEQGENGQSADEIPVVLTYEGEDKGWTSSHPNLIPNVPAGTNSVVIPEDSIKDGTNVTAFSYDPAGNKSTPATKKAGIDDRTPLNDLVITPIDGNTKADAIADAVQITASTDPNATLGLSDKDNADISLGNDPVKADDKGLVNVVLLRHGLSEEDKQRIKDHFTKQAVESNGKIATPTFVELQSAEDNAKIDQPANGGDKPTLTLTATLKDAEGNNLKDPSEALTGEIRPLQANAADHPLDGTDEQGENAGKPTAPQLEAPKRFAENGTRTDKTDEEIGTAVLTLPNDAIVGDLVEFEFLTEGDPNDPAQQPELKKVTVVKTGDNTWEGLTDEDKQIITGDGNGKSITINDNTLTIKKDYVKDNSPVRATSIDQAGKKSPYVGADGKDFVTTDFDEVTILKEVENKAYDLDEAANSNPELFKVTGKSEAGATLTFVVTDKDGKEHTLTHKLAGDITSPGADKEFTVLIVEKGKQDKIPASLKTTDVVILELPEGADIIPSKPKTAAGEDGEVPAQPEYEPNVKVTAHVIGEKAPSAQSAVTTPALANDQASHPNDQTDPTAPTIEVVEKLGASGEFTVVNDKKVGTDNTLDGEHGALVTMPSDAVAGDQVVISFRQEKDGTPDTKDTTVTFTKQADGTWTSDTPELIASTTATKKDTVVIPADKVEGRSPSTITAQTIDQAGRKSDSNTNEDGNQPATADVPKDRQTYIDGLTVTPQDLGADNGGDGSKMDVNNTPTLGQISDKDPEQLKLNFSVEEGATVTIEVFAIDPKTGKIKLDESGKEVVAFTKVLTPQDYTLTGKVENNVDPDNVFTRGDVEYTLMESDTANTGNHQFSTTDVVRISAKIDGKAKGYPENNDREVGDVPNSKLGHPSDDTAPIVSVVVANEPDTRPKEGATNGEMEANPDVGKAFATVTFPAQSDATEVTITFVPEGQGQIQTQEQDFVYKRVVKSDKSEVWQLQKADGDTVPAGLAEEIAYSASGSTLKIPAEAIEHSTNILVKAKDFFLQSAAASKTLPVDLVTKTPTLSVQAKDQSIPADGNPDEFNFVLNGEAGSVVTVTVTKPVPPGSPADTKPQTYSFDVTLPGNVDSTQNVTTEGTPQNHTLREHGVTVENEGARTDLTVIAQKLGFKLDVGDSITAVAKATGKAVSPKTADTTIEALTKHGLDEDESIDTEGDFADKAVEAVSFSKTREDGKDSVTATLPRKDSDTEPDVGDGDTVTFTFPYEKPAKTEGGEPTNEEATLTLVYDGTTKKWKVAEDGDPNNTGITVEDDGFTVNFPAEKIHADRGTEKVVGDKVIKITALSEDLAGNQKTSEQEVLQDQTVYFILDDSVQAYDNAVNNVSDRDPEFLRLVGEAEVGALVTFTVKNPDQKQDYVVTLLAVDENAVDKPALPAGASGYLMLTNVAENPDHYGEKTGHFSHDLYEPKDGSVIFGPSASPTEANNLTGEWTITQGSTVTASASIAGKQDKQALNSDDNSEDQTIFSVRGLDHGVADHHLNDTKPFSFDESDKGKPYFYDIGKKGQRGTYIYGEDLKFEASSGGAGLLDLVLKMPQADAYEFRVGIPYRGQPVSDVTIGTPSTSTSRRAKTEYVTYIRQDDGSWKLEKTTKPLGKIMKHPETGEAVDLLDTLEASTETITILGDFIAPSTARPKVENSVSVQIKDLAGKTTNNQSVPVPVATVVEAPEFTSAKFADNSDFADNNPDIVTYGIRVRRPQGKDNEAVTLVIKQPAIGAEGQEGYEPEKVFGKVTIPAGKTDITLVLKEAKGAETVTDSNTPVALDGSDTATLIVPAGAINTGGWVTASAEVRGSIPSTAAAPAENMRYQAIDRGEASGKTAERHTDDKQDPADVALTPAPQAGQQGYNVGDNSVTLAIDRHDPNNKASIYKGEELLVNFTQNGVAKTVKFVLGDDWNWTFSQTANTPTNPFGTRVPTGTKEKGYEFKVDIGDIGTEVSATRVDFAGKSSTTQRANVPDNRFDKDGENTDMPEVGYGTVSGELNTDEKRAMTVLTGNNVNSGDVVITPGADNRVLQITYIEPQAGGSAVQKTIYAHRDGNGDTWIFREGKDPASAVVNNPPIRTETANGKTVLVLAADKVATQTAVDVTAYGDNQATENSAVVRQPNQAANFDDNTPATATKAQVETMDTNSEAGMQSGLFKGDMMIQPTNQPANVLLDTVEMKIVFTGDADLQQGEQLTANAENTIVAKRLGDKDWALFHVDNQGNADETNPVSPHFATIDPQTGVVVLKGRATKDNETVKVISKDAYGNTIENADHQAPAEDSNFVKLDPPTINQVGSTGTVNLGNNATHATVTIKRKGATGQLETETVEITRREVTEMVTITAANGQPKQFEATFFKLSYKIGNQTFSENQVEEAKAKLKEKGITADDDGNLSINNYDETDETIDVTTKLEKSGQDTQTLTDSHQAKQVKGTDQDTDADVPDVVALADGGANIFAGGDNQKLVVDYQRNGSPAKATFTKQGDSWVFDSSNSTGGAEAADFELPNSASGAIKLINSKVDDFTFVTATGYDVKDNQAEDRDQVGGDDNNLNDVDEPKWKTDPATKDMIMERGDDNYKTRVVFNQKVPNEDRVESKTLVGKYNKETYRWELFEETTPNAADDQLVPFNTPENSKVATIDPTTGAIRISAQVLSPKTDSNENKLVAEGYDQQGNKSDPVDGFFSIAPPTKVQDGAHYKVTSLNDGIFQVDTKNSSTGDKATLNFMVSGNNGNDPAKWIYAELSYKSGKWQINTLRNASGVEDNPRSGTIDKANPPFALETVGANTFRIKNGGGHRLYGDSKEADTDRKADTDSSTTYEDKLRVRVIDFNKLPNTKVIAPLLDTNEYKDDNSNIPKGALPEPAKALQPLVTGDVDVRGRVKIVADDPNPAISDVDSKNKPLGQNRVEIQYTSDNGFLYNVGINKRTDGKWELDDRAKQWKVHDHFANVGADGIFTTTEGATKEGEFILKAPYAHNTIPVYATGIDTTVNGRSDTVSGLPQETNGMVDYRIPGSSKRGLEYYKRWRDSVGKDVVIITGDVYEGKTGRLSPKIQSYLKDPKYASGARLFEYGQTFNTVHENKQEEGLRIWGYDAQGGDVYTIKGAVGAKELTGPLKPVFFDLKGGNDILVVENDFGENALAYRNANLDAGAGDDLLVVGSSHAHFTLVENLREDAGPSERFRFVDNTDRKRADGQGLEDAYDVEGKHRDPNTSAPELIEDKESSTKANPREDLRTPVVQDSGSALVPGVGGSIVQSNIEMGDGNDAILVTGSRAGISLGKIGTAAISRSTIKTGAGHDQIIVAPNGVEGQPVLGIGTTRTVAARGAIDTDTIIEMGTGNDYLKTVQISNGAQINMGADNDILDATRIISRFGSTTIDMDSGNDVVHIRGEARAFNGNTTTINLGEGDDTLYFRGNSDIFTGGSTVNGSFEAKLDGGAGTDTFVLQFGARANTLTDGVHLSTENFKNMEVIKMEKGTKLKITASELLTSNNVKLLVQQQDGGDADANANRTVDLEGFNPTATRTASEDGKNYSVYTSTAGNKEVWIEDNANFMII